MQIPFTGSQDNFRFLEFIFYVLVSGIIATFLVAPAYKVTTFSGTLGIIVIGTIIYLTITTTAVPWNISLNPTIYPLPPHLGHEGISNQLMA